MHPTERKKSANVSGEMLLNRPIVSNARYLSDANIPFTKLFIANAF